MFRRRRVASAPPVIQPIDDAATAGEPDTGDVHVPGLLSSKKPPVKEATEIGADASYEDLRDALQQAINDRYGSAGAYGPCCWICETYDDRVIYQGPDGKYYQVTYAVENDGDADVDIDLGPIVEVKSTFVPAETGAPDVPLVSHEPRAATGELSRVCREQGVRLFVDATSLQASEAPQWMPVLPIPGTYQHPAYGEIAISPERNAQFVANFNAGVYQSRVAVDAEHESKLSGAVAWLTELRLNEDGSADGKAEWTPRGEKLLDEDAYRYVSPEWYDEWTDPATGTVYQDVLVGAAITTRPFFKEKALRALVAREGRLFSPRPGAKGADQFFDALPIVTREDPLMSVDPKSFAELQERVRAVEAERDSYKQTAETAIASAKEASERVKVIEVSARRKRFTDEVMGKSEANPHRWYGEVAGHVTMLEQLADQFGEDSEQVKYILDTNRTAAAQLRATGAFTEVGRAGVGPDAPAERMTSLARQRMTEKGIPEAQAMAEVASENPSLYREYVEATRVKV